jgi:hypothetical protein
MECEAKKCALDETLQPFQGGVEEEEDDDDEGG